MKTMILKQKLLVTGNYATFLKSQLSQDKNKRKLLLNIDLKSIDGEENGKKGESENLSSLKTKSLV